MLRPLVCILLGVTATGGVLLEQACGTELPEKLKKAISQAKDNLSSQQKNAKEQLVKAFGKSLEKTRKATKLSSVEKLALIEGLESEQRRFEEQGWIPFSPSMRKDAMVYLAVLKEANGKVSDAYDSAVNFHIKRNEKEEAKKLEEEWATLVKPTVVGKWAVMYGKSLSASWTFLSDGTKQGARVGGTWTMDGKEIIIRHASGEIDRGTSSPDGHSMEISAESGKGTATLDLTQ